MVSETISGGRRWFRQRLQPEDFLSLAVIGLCLWQVLYLLASGQLGVKGGLEMADIAERLVRGQGFASPYLPADVVRPTMVSPPLYVGMMAGIFSLFGIKTDLAHGILQLMNVLFNAVTLVCLFRVCQRLFNPLTARLFAVLFILHPHILLLSSSIWETALTTMLLSIMLWFMVCAMDRYRIAHQILLALLFGIIALSNPAWTLSYPLFCLFLYRPWAAGPGISKTLLPIAVIFISYLLVVSPWLIRNYQVAGELTYVRNMSGPELFKGNHLQSGGGHGMGFHDYWIYNSEQQQRIYQAMGEQAYDQWMQQRALEVIQENPGHYLTMTLVRIAMWWSGDVDVLWKWYQVGYYNKLAMGVVMTVAGTLTTLLAIPGAWLLRRRLRQLWPVFVLVFILPIPYYLMIIGFRYQASLMAFTLIPVAYCLAVYLPVRLPWLNHHRAYPQ